MSTPAYNHLFQKLRREILDNRYEAGQRMPTERELCELHSVSRITVRHALRLLHDEGLIERRQGRGTHVRTLQPRKIPLLSKNYTGSMRDEAPGLKRRLISREETRVPKDLVQELGINPEDPCLVVQRLDELNESPLAFDTGWIPITYAEGIMDPLLIRVDFLEAWVKAARIELSHMRQTVEAVEANKTEAKLLEIPINSPLLMTIETFYNRQGNAVGSFKSRYRSDRIRLVTQHSCERNSGKEW